MFLYDVLSFQFRPRSEPICRCFCRSNNLDCSDGRCDNRAMFTECPKNCLGKGNDCKNRRFAKVSQFIIEYVGEVVSSEEFAKRLKRYGRDPSHTHHYMFEIGSMIIDATKKGNCSRFMNHSCEPNAVCEKWYVPRTPCAIDRIGFFAKRDIELGEEITFDYQFENYGREAQRCFCGATTCSGWIGKPPELLDDIDEDMETESEDSDGSTDEDTKVMDTSLQHIFVANGLPNIFKSWLRTASPETLTRDDLNLKQCIIRSLLAMQSCAEAINVTILFPSFILCLRLESSV
ncbi:unnamed protein product [Angiostrongylus costaricensis]|uniref:Histone-lysine N-methyltransferase n=1 Tax=Angiostrongylus costaricensis TaxID=334426 RepID=A0A0R3PH23_ANGCS|nr:unnamed protein product [Angiostrongylus costaricensis]